MLNVLDTLSSRCILKCSPDSPGAAFKHDADPSGVYETLRVGTMHECIAWPVTGFRDRDSRGSSTLNYYAARKGLRGL